ncbi:serine hydrolase [Bacteroidota bacterium]
MKKVNENTLFMLGSNTKAFTGTSLCILDHQGKVSLDDKVTKWLPDFRLYDDLATQYATVADLLCHRIGIATGRGDFTFWYSDLSRDEIIEKLRYIEPVFDFRAGYGYCNAAFVTAGEIIPKVTGTSWETFVEENILTPLEMNRTQMLSANARNTSNMSKGHMLTIDDRFLNVGIPLIDNVGASGGMSSSVKDMSNWLICLLNEGKFKNRQVIPKEVIQKVQDPHNIINFDKNDMAQTHFYLYGLGFRIKDRNGKLVFFHGGGVDGFLSKVILIPSEKVGIVILSNSESNQLFNDLASELQDAFLGLPYQGYTKKSLKNFKKEQAEQAQWLDSLKQIVALNNKPPLSLKSFTGTFHNEIYGEIEVSKVNKGLAIHFSHHPDLTGNLEYINRNSFLCTYSIPGYSIKEIPFKMENGKVTSLTLRVINSTESIPYEFIKK